MSDNDLLEALRPVATELRRLNVRFYIGGSVASSYHGAARSTLDVDLIADLDSTAATKMLAGLHEQYYVSEKAVRDALVRQSCFNMIHLSTSFKIDVFVRHGSEF